MKAEFLLSDEFTSFSAKVAALHTQKKEFDAEFKKFFAEHKARNKALDEEALALQQEFDNWVISNNKEKS